MFARVLSYRSATDLQFSEIELLVDLEQMKSVIDEMARSENGHRMSFEIVAKQSADVTND